jgi:hypothetical protein
MKRPWWLDPGGWLVWLLFVTYGLATALCSAVAGLFRKENRR